MKAADVMTREVFLVTPDHSARAAALLMSKRGIGALPVGEDDRLVGMITDRDIAVRAVANGKGPDAKVRELMSTPIKYCFEDEDVADVCDNMTTNQLRRLPVLSRAKRLIGIVSLGDLSVPHVVGGADHPWPAAQSSVIAGTAVPPAASFDQPSDY